MPITISYAATDHDAVAIHHFLCRVAGPLLPGPIDPELSINEVWRCIQDEAAIVAWTEQGEMVGTIGIVCVNPWWGHIRYLANRWFFTIPGSGAGKLLLKEAKKIAVDSEMELHIIAEERGKITILNRSKLRQGHPGLANSPNKSFARAT